jgi:hypothetical protein
MKNGDRRHHQLLDLSGGLNIGLIGVVDGAESLSEAPYIFLGRIENVGILVSGFP